MNTTQRESARRVILAGISEERLDLFLLLNEGAGYEVTGVIDTRGAGESSRIAEILGVPVLAGEQPEGLPDADLLIYGEEQFRSMGERLHLGEGAVWHENDAWRYLTEGDAAPEGRAADDATDAAMALAASEWTGDEEAKTVAVEPLDAEEDTGAGETRAAVEDMAAAEETGSGEAGPEGVLDPAPAGAAFATQSPWEGGEPDAVTHADPPGHFMLLHDFAVASHDLESLYRWVLARTIEMSGTAAGGVRPHKPLHPFVWQDRRRASRDELPAFLRAASPEPGVSAFSLGGPETPGGGSVRLVGTPSDEVATEIGSFLSAVAPALRSVAELDDHRRERAWEEVIRRLVDELADREGEVGDAIADTCRGLAQTFGARECVVLFGSDDGEVVRGYSSNGQRIVAPAASGLFGGGGNDEPRRLADEDGRWHYHIPFTRGTRRGALALFGVTASPGSVEALGHQAVSMANALAEHLPEAAWQA